MAKNESDSQDITQSTKKVVIKTIKNTRHSGNYDGKEK